MQIQDFVKVYEAKSDEELIQLAVASEQLTSEARLALQGELSRRQIKFAEDSRISQQDWDSDDVAPVPVIQRLGHGEWQGVGDFLAQVLRNYHANYWLYFKITAPAVIISTVAVITSRKEAREILHNLPRGPELLAHHAEILEVSLINYSSWMVGLIAFDFVFGATCIAVEEGGAGFTPSAWRSFLNLRDRLSSFLRLGLVLFVLLLAAEAISILLATGVLWVLHQLRVHPTSLVIWGLFYGLAGVAVLVVSRFFLSVPAVILDDCRVWQAMFCSDTLTKGKWLTLAALIAKSLVGGYIAGMCPFWLASLIQFSAPPPSWFGWIPTIASMIAVTVVEPTMFVGFALLYLKMAAPDSAPDKGYSPRN